MSGVVIDGHAYCFPPIGATTGFEQAAHLRYLHREMADHHQPAVRLRDRAVLSPDALVNSDDPTVEGVKEEVTFRVGDFGRFVWKVNGEEYVKQYLPPYLADLSHSPELLLAQMDYAGVKHAVLHVHPIFGFLNEYLVDCVRRHGDRLIALAGVREWAIEKDPLGAAAEVEKAFESGLQGLQFTSLTRQRFGVTDSWDSPACRPFWDRVAGLGKPILFTLEPYPKPTLDCYLEQLRTWEGWLRRYPHVQAVLTHGFPWRLLITETGDSLEIPEELFRPFRVSPKAACQLLLPISVGNIWDYPYKELQPTVAKLVKEIGADRLMWGTDMPNVERFCNYRQTLEMFRTHCKGVISDDDITAITGRTAARIFSIRT